jgi:hypothetical protein
MWLWIACTVGMISALLHPFSKRLQATGLWAGKVLSAEGSESITPTGLQDALTDGWPSSVGLIGIILPFIAGLLGLFHVWWAGIVVFICTIVVSAIMDRMPIAPKFVERYIAFF